MRPRCWLMSLAQMISGICVRVMVRILLLPYMCDIRMFKLRGIGERKLKRQWERKNTELATCITCATWRNYIHTAHCKNWLVQTVKKMVFSTAHLCFYSQDCHVWDVAYYAFEHIVSGVIPVHWIQCVRRKKRWLIISTLGRVTSVASTQA